MQSKYQTNLYDTAKLLRQNMTPAEKVLWKVLRNNRLGVKIRRQSVFVIGTYHYIVDFYCPKHKLIIEIDGDIHNLDEIKEIDKFREDIFKDMGYQVIRFSNKEVNNNLEEIVNKIRAIINND
jgi:cyclase